MATTADTKSANSSTSAAAAAGGATAGGASSGTVVTLTTEAALGDSDRIGAERTMALMPDWMHHEAPRDPHATSQQTSEQYMPIYSCDMDPTGTRAATAGGDNKIKIWSTAPLHSTAAERDEDKHPRLLAVLVRHSNSVNAVKFNNTGEMLASGSDDKSVALWKLVPAAAGDADAPESSNLLSADEQSAIENWVCVTSLFGHTHDVQDVCWSPDGKRLASCSVDNTIIIWDTATHAKLCTLGAAGSGHTDWVRGVAWDPVGKYLASESQDGTVIIWEPAKSGVNSSGGADNWTPVRVLNDHLESRSNFAGDSHRQMVFNRLSWSPDGSSLAFPRGNWKDTYVSPLLTRSNWNTRLRYTGHRKPTTVTRFCPVIFKPFAAPGGGGAAAASSSKDAGYFTVLAIGSMDNTITVWLSNRPTPLAHIENFFQQSILDISWGADGYSLLAASHDGTVCFFRFTPKDFGGVPITQTEKIAYWKRTYGDQYAALLPRSSSLGGALTSPPTGLPNAQLMTDPHMLALETKRLAAAQRTAQAAAAAAAEAAERKRQTDAASGAAAAGAAAVPLPADEVRKLQKEDVGRGGRRRIAPVPQAVLIAAQRSLSQSQRSQSNGSQSAAAAAAPPAQQSSSLSLQIQSSLAPGAAISVSESASQSASLQQSTQPQLNSDTTPAVASAATPITSGGAGGDSTKKKRKLIPDQATTGFGTPATPTTAATAPVTTTATTSATAAVPPPKKKKQKPNAAGTTGADANGEDGVSSTATTPVAGAAAAAGGKPKKKKKAAGEADTAATGSDSDSTPLIQKTKSATGGAAGGPAKSTTAAPATSTTGAPAKKKAAAAGGAKPKPATGAGAGSGGKSGPAAGSTGVATSGSSIVVLQQTAAVPSYVIPPARIRTQFTISVPQPAAAVHARSTGIAAAAVMDPFGGAADLNPSILSPPPPPPPVQLEVHLHAEASSYAPPHSALTASRGGSELWSDKLEWSAITLTAANSQLVAAACVEYDDGTQFPRVSPVGTAVSASSSSSAAASATSSSSAPLHPFDVSGGVPKGTLYVYSSSTGRRLLPALVLPGLPAFLTLYAAPALNTAAATTPTTYLLIVTSDGTVQVFDCALWQRVLTCSVRALLPTPIPAPVTPPTPATGAATTGKANAAAATTATRAASVASSAAAIVPTTIASMTLTRATATGTSSDGGVVPVVTLAPSGFCYSWHAGLANWMRIKDSRFWASEFTSQLSLFAPTAPLSTATAAVSSSSSSVGAAAAGDNSIPAGSTSFGSLALSLSGGSGGSSTSTSNPHLLSALLHLNPMEQAARTLSHLENTLAVCALVGGGTSAAQQSEVYTQTMQAYVAKLVEYAVSAPSESESGSFAMRRLRELVDQLLGPVHAPTPPPPTAATVSSAAAGGWDAYLFGGVLSKRELLESLLPAMGHRSLSKLVQHTVESLAFISTQTQPQQPQPQAVLFTPTEGANATPASASSSAAASKPAAVKSGSSMAD